MLNVRSHYRPKMPNSLAFFAVLLLLISSAAGIHTNLNAKPSGQETGISVDAETTGDDAVNAATRKKSRGLNLGLLLFRRG